MTETKLNFNHPYLQSRSIGSEWAESFGIGHDGTKILVSVHDMYGKFVAYVPRKLGHEQPKYSFDFNKGNYLYNYHRARAAKRKVVIVVEGFFSCIRLTQFGYPCVVALMGSAMSIRQEGLLLRYWDNVLVMMDGDEAGRRAQKDIGARLSKHGLKGVFGIDLPDKVQPDHLDLQQFQTLLAGVKR